MPSTLSLFGIFLLIGAVPIAIKSARRVGAYRQMQAWPKVRATITRSFVREGADSDGTSQLPEFAFRYTVAGVEYTSSLHTEGTPFPANEADVRRMLKRFPVGSTALAAVEPADPSHAILDTGFPNAWNVLRRASLAAFVVGFVMMFAELFLAK